MSRKGICCDNAQRDQFLFQIQGGVGGNGIFAAVEDARAEVFGYLEGCDNRIGRHSGIGYQSPLEFEKQLKLTNKIRSSESFVS